MAAQPRPRTRVRGQLASHSPDYAPSAATSYPLRREADIAVRMVKPTQSGR